MALTPAAMWNIISTDDHTPANVLTIVNTLMPINFSGPPGNPRGVWLLAFISLLIQHIDPIYFEILHILLFKNASSAAITQRPFAHEIVEFDEVWIIQYLTAARLPALPGIIPIQPADRDRLIRTLIDEYVTQYVSAAPAPPQVSKDTWPYLNPLLNTCRTQGQPEFIQYAFMVSANHIGSALDIYNFTEDVYGNDIPEVGLLMNGLVESITPGRFQGLNVRLDYAGRIPGTAKPAGGFYLNRTRLDGSVLAGTPADVAAIQQLQRYAGFSLTPANLALVLQPPNLAEVPNLTPFLQPIRDAVTNMTAGSPVPLAIQGVPYHYLELVTQQPSGKTLAEKAAEMGNIAVMDYLITTGVTITLHPLMQIALTGGHYALAQALWNHDHNYPDPWFPPGFVPNDALLARDTSAPFRNTFYSKYAIFNPGSLSGVGRSTIGRVAAAALGLPASSRPALSRADQEAVADSVIRTLNAMPDFVSDSGGKTTLNLLTLSSIRDELERITDPTVWNDKQLLPLIAKKGAVLDGTILPSADLLATGLALGADPNVIDADGNAALHYVAGLSVMPVTVARATTPRSILMLKTLLASPAIDVNILNPAGNTPLHLMVEKGLPSWEHVTLLSRAAKLDYNIVNGAGETPLMVLVTKNPLEPHKKVLTILLNGSDVTIKDNNGHTALRIAIYFTMDDVYLATVVPALAKGLPSFVDERAIAIPGHPLIVEALDRIVAAAAAAVPLPAIPAWLPDEYKDILTDNTIPPSIVAPIRQLIDDISWFLTQGLPSQSDAIMQELANSNFWWGARAVKAYPIPVVSTIPVIGGFLKLPLFYDANQATTFDAKFEDNTQISLRTPYKAAYRALPTTIYNPNGIPTLAAGTSLADQTAAQANNDALVKLVGREYITAGNQRLLKKMLDELYYAQYNPHLGNDPLTVLLHLRSKLDCLLKYHAISQKNSKDASVAKLGTTLTTFVTSLLSGLGMRFPTSVPIPIAFPAITFVGVSPHAAGFVVAGVVAGGGGVPVMPGLRAPVVVPPPRGGLRVLRGLGIGGRVGAPPPGPLQNIFTGDLIDPMIVGSPYPDVITLGPDDTMTYLPPPLGPITNVNGVAVSKLDSFYKFLVPFGLTAVVRGRGYLLRPAELFLTLFHQTAPQIAALMRDRNHPFVRLLRDYCIPAGIGAATHKAMPLVVAELNKLRGKLPV